MLTAVEKYSKVQFTLQFANFIIYVALIVILSPTYFTL